MEITNTVIGNAAIERQNQFAIANTISQNGAAAAAWDLQEAAIAAAIFDMGITGFNDAFNKSKQTTCSLHLHNYS